MFDNFDFDMTFFKFSLQCGLDSQAEPGRRIKQDKKSVVYIVQNQCRKIKLMCSCFELISF